MSREPSKRKRIERGLYLDGSTYYACATPPGGRAAVWKSLGPVGRMEARRLRDEFVAAVRLGRVTATPGDRRRRTFSEVADDWLAAQQALVDVGEIAPRTLEVYEVSVRRHLKPTFGSRSIRSIAPNDLVAWYASQRKSGAAPWSIKGRWVALRCILAHAVRHGWIEPNPADSLTSRERPKTAASRKRFLTEEEMAALLGAASERYRVLIAICLFAGLRISEALGLTWEDVDLDGGQLRVRYQLNRKGKRVRLKDGCGAARRHCHRLARLLAPSAPPRKPVLDGQGSRPRHVECNRHQRAERHPRSDSDREARGSAGRHRSRPPSHVREHAYRARPRPGVRRRPARPHQPGDHATGLRAPVQSCETGRGRARRARGGLRRNAALTSGFGRGRLTARALGDLIENHGREILGHPIVVAESGVPLRLERRLPAVIPSAPLAHRCENCPHCPPGVTRMG